MCILIGTKFSLVFTTEFWVKMQKSTFFKKKVVVFLCIFMKLKSRWSLTSLPDLKKKTKK